MRTVFVALCILSTLSSCESKKLGVAGSTCSAASDCAGTLQCIASTCVDPAVIKKATEEQKAAEPNASAESKAKVAYNKERDEAERLAQIEQKKKDDQQAAELAALMKELKGLQEEQNKIKAQKDRIEDQLKNVQDETERQRLLAEKASLDAQLAENKSSGKKPQSGISESKNVDDPLDGL